MSERPLISSDDVRALAEIAQLDLPSAGVSALQTSLTDYLERVSSLRSLDPGDREPPVITYEEVDRNEPGE